MRYKKSKDESLPYRLANGRKVSALLLSFALIIAFAIGGTRAYLMGHSNLVQNSFEPSYVDCEVTEAFDGKTKRNVNVCNTGDTQAYIRVKLVTYRVNDNNQHIGGTSKVPDFTLGENWVRYGDHYYYTLPVDPGDEPKAQLLSSIDLTSDYQDADAGKQVIEVMAEAIQSSPADAVGQSWGVVIQEGSVTPYNG